MAADTIKLEAESRTRTGTAESRRLRRNGLVPASVYGHGEDSVSISTSAEGVDHLLQSGSQVAEVSIDGKDETVLVKDVQWDTFNTHVLHLDLLRVSKGEKVEIEIPIELHGVSPGVNDGGVLDHQLHALSASCPALQIPEKLEVNINELKIGDSVHVSDLDIPGQVESLVPPETLVVQVNEPMEIPEEEDETDVGPVEPEVIGREGDDEEGEED